MCNTVSETLTNSCQVVELLLQRFGPELVWQVEQLSEHIFRAWLNNGTVALAIVQTDGTVDIRELEDMG